MKANTEKTNVARARNDSIDRGNEMTQYCIKKNPPTKRNTEHKTFKRINLALRVSFSSSNSKLAIFPFSSDILS